MKPILRLCVVLAFSLSLFDYNLTAQPRPGTYVSDIVAPDANGNMLRLSDFNTQNYVLLHYWASENPVAGMMLPEIAELYHQTRLAGTPFEVFSVSLDNNWAQWLEASDYYIVNWRANVCDLQGGHSNTVTRMGITHIPTKLLLAPGGYVEAVNPDMDYLRQKFLRPISYNNQIHTQYQVYVGNFHRLADIVNMSDYGEVKITPIDQNRNAVKVEGEFNSLEEVNDVVLEMHGRGYSQAFIIVSRSNLGGGIPTYAEQPAPVQHHALGGTGYDGSNMTTHNISPNRNAHVQPSGIGEHIIMEPHDFPMSSTIRVRPPQSISSPNISETNPVMDSQGTIQFYDNPPPPTPIPTDIIIVPGSPIFIDGGNGGHRKQDDLNPPPGRDRNPYLNQLTPNPHNPERIRSYYYTPRHKKNVVEDGGRPPSSSDNDFIMGNERQSNGGFKVPSIEEIEKNEEIFYTPSRSPINPAPKK